MTQRQQFECFYVGRYLADALYAREYTFDQLLDYVKGERKSSNYSNPEIDLEWQEFKLTYKAQK